MQHFVRGDGVQYVLQARSIWPVQEELLPEAVRQLRVFVVLLSRMVSDASGAWATGAAVCALSP
jgi:hypothetical protein